MKQKEDGMHIKNINDKYLDYKMTDDIFKEFFKNYWFTRNLIGYFLNENEEIINYYENINKIIKYDTFNIEQFFTILYKSVFEYRISFD